MPSLLQLNSISTQVEHGLQVPTVTHSPTAFNIWEYLSLFILPSAAAVVYAILHIKLPTVTQVVIPFAMFILIGMILLRTPREYYTTIFLTLQLAGITILATSDNSYSTSSLTYIGSIIASYGFWHFIVHAFLSTKGVKSEEMGCMGDVENAIVAFANRIIYGIQSIANGIASGIKQFSNAIVALENAIVALEDAIVALGNAIIAIVNIIKDIADGIKNAIVVNATLGHDNEARPPPYDISTLSNKQHHMPDRKGIARRCSF